MYHEDSSRSTLSNVTFNGNSAERGGAIANANVCCGIPGPSSVTLENVILWGDTATISDNEIYNDSPPTGGIATIDHSVMQGGCSPGSTCTNLLTTDPKLQPLAHNGGFKFSARNYYTFGYKTRFRDVRSEGGNFAMKEKNKQEMVSCPCSSG